MKSLMRQAKTRWHWLLLAAAVVANVYGFVGFPNPTESDVPEVSAHERTTTRKKCTFGRCFYVTVHVPHTHRAPTARPCQPGSPGCRPVTTTTARRCQPGSPGCRPVTTTTARRCRPGHGCRPVTTTTARRPVTTTTARRCQPGSPGCRPVTTTTARRCQPGHGCRPVTTTTARRPAPTTTARRSEVVTTTTARRSEVVTTTTARRPPPRACTYGGYYPHCNRRPTGPATTTTTQRPTITTPTTTTTATTPTTNCLNGAWTDGSCKKTCAQSADTGSNWDSAGCLHGIVHGYIDGEAVSSDPVGDKEKIAKAARIFAMSNPRISFDAEAFADAISSTGRKGESTRDEFFVGTCAALKGCPVSGSPTARHAWLKKEELTSLPFDEFVERGREPITSGEEGTVFSKIRERDPCPTCWDPPVTTPINRLAPPDVTNPCTAGYSVIQAHVSGTDNGCRPARCDFGRRTDGWCLPPTRSTPPVVYVAGEDVDEDAGQVAFRVVLSHAVPQTVTVRVDTVDGTATAGSDYTAVRRTVTFAANTTLWFVNVPVRDDTVAENDETFSLAMSSPSPNAGLSTPSAEATIRDNDTAPLLRVQNLNVSCAAHINEVFRVAASWAAPNGGADSYHAQLSDDPRGFLAADDPAVITDMSGSTLLALRGTTSVVDTYWVHVQASRVNGGVGPVTRASAACTALLPSYVAPPAAPECPNNWHEHGFDCVPDHTVPIVCGTSAHQYKVHNIFTPGGHLTRTHPACASVPDVCSTGFHDHAGTCVRTHEDPPLPCRANRRLVWQNTIHGTSEVLACPDPAVDTELLVDTAGKDLTLSFSVDVTSGHVEPTRTFNITATDGTAVNGTHYTMASPVTATFDSATQTYTGSIPTIARQDHGSYPRTFTITVTDAHPLRGHVSVSATATINPPAIERQ